MSEQAEKRVRPYTRTKAALEAKVEEWKAKALALRKENEALRAEVEKYRILATENASGGRLLRDRIAELKSAMRKAAKMLDDAAS